jgi:GNAT superfamily N-acetyltransferase
VSVLTIVRLDRSPSDTDIGQLAELLVDAIDSGAGVSFMAGLTIDVAAAWCRSTVASLPRRGIVLVARDASGIAGTVQLHPAWAPNQPHRADVAKLIVHRRARRRGVGTALMTTLEAEARAEGFTLLLLDTVKGDSGERLYTSLGWTRVGEVPNFALDTVGNPITTVFFYKAVS